MNSKRKVFRMLASGVLSAALLAGPVLAANPEIRVGSYKGSVLPMQNFLKMTPWTCPKTWKSVLKWYGLSMMFGGKTDSQNCPKMKTS